MGRHLNLGLAIRGMIDQLKYDGQEVDTGHWQGVETQGKPDLITTEIINAQFEAPIPDTQSALEVLTHPNMPWAETEFQERVGGEPHNPHHSLEEWPWWHGQEGQTMYEGMFSHTYSERFFPLRIEGDPGENVHRFRKPMGIRYQYGDLNDVVNLLRKYPYTRQATFPIFFPEDTGAVHGGRIPCTLHYHFLLRHDRLHLWYPIRSCDAVRHFRDDVYMASRLCQWVIEVLSSAGGHWAPVKPGTLHFTAYSFHVHAGDKHLL